MPDSFTGYKVTAVYYIDTDDVVMRSKLIKIKQSGTSVIILHHYNLDEVLHIFKMVQRQDTLIYGKILSIYRYVYIHRQVKKG